MKIKIDSLLDTIPEIIFCTDAGRNLVRVNNMMARKLGYTHHEFADMKIDHLVSDENRHAIRKYYIKVTNGIDSNLNIGLIARTGECVDVDLTSNYVQPDGEKTVQDEASVVNDSGIMINVARDVTEKTEMECQIKRSKSEIELLSIVDKLTGLYNGKYLESDLKNEIKRSRRYDTTLSIAIIRISKFKIFEFVHGRQECENIQKILSTLILENLRCGVDKAYVCNMEETVIILPETSTEQAFEVSERLRKLFYLVGFGMSIHNGDTISYSSSLNVGVASTNGESCDLLDNARDALAMSKNIGGDNVYIYGN